MLSNRPPEATGIAPWNVTPNPALYDPITGKTATPDGAVPGQNPALYVPPAPAGQNPATYVPPPPQSSATQGNRNDNWSAPAPVTPAPVKPVHPNQNGFVSKTEGYAKQFGNWLENQVTSPFKNNEPTTEERAEDWISNTTPAEDAAEQQQTIKAARYGAFFAKDAGVGVLGMAKGAADMAGDVLGIGEGSGAALRSKALTSWSTAHPNATEEQVRDATSSIDSDPKLNGKSYIEQLKDIPRGIVQSFTKYAANKQSAHPLPDAVWGLVQDIGSAGIPNGAQATGAPTSSDWNDLGNKYGKALQVLTQEGVRHPGQFGVLAGTSIEGVMSFPALAEHAYTHVGAVKDLASNGIYQLAANHYYANKFDPSAPLATPDDAGAALRHAQPALGVKGQIAGALITKARQDQWAEENPGVDPNSFVPTHIAAIQKLINEPGISQEGETTKGSTSFVAGNKATIGLGPTADLTTAIHELFHTFRPTMSALDLTTLARSNGIDPADFNKPLANPARVAAEEALARGFERQFYDGSTLPKALKPVFAHLHSEFQRVYNANPVDAADIANPVYGSTNVRSAYNRFLGGDGRVAPGQTPGPAFYAPQQNAGVQSPGSTPTPAQEQATEQATGFPSKPYKTSPRQMPESLLQTAQPVRANVTGSGQLRQASHDPDFVKEMSEGLVKNLGRANHVTAKHFILPDGTLTGPFNTMYPSMHEQEAYHAVSDATRQKLAARALSSPYYEPYTKALRSGFVRVANERKALAITHGENITPEAARTALRVAGEHTGDIAHDVLYRSPRRENSSFEEMLDDPAIKRVLRQTGHEPAPTFYSHAQRVIESKMGGQMPAEQLEKTLLANGVKLDEMKWGGLDDLINARRGGAPITKQEALDTLKQHDLGLTEFHKGDSPRVTQSMIDRAERSGDWGEHQRLTELQENQQLGRAGHARYDDKQLPGGKNYREMLLTLPPKSREIPLTAEEKAEQSALTERKQVAAIGLRRDVNPLTPVENTRLADLQSRSISRNDDIRNNTYKSSHWDEPNVLAHIRMNDRVGPNGEKVLHVEELQSDWHQQGRKEGYVDQNARANIDSQVRELGLDPNTANVSSIRAKGGSEELAYAFYKHYMQGGTVPSAPFSKTWHELALKRVLRHAAENGYDRVSWTGGEDQGVRYSEDDGGTDDQSRTAGMKGFYDKIIPDYLNKYGKKWGAKVENTQIGPKNTIPWSVLTPEGEHLGSFGSKATAQEYVDRIKANGSAIGYHVVEEPGANGKTVQSIPITGSMRKSVMQEGQPLFQKSRADSDGRAPEFYSQARKIVDEKAPNRFSADQLEGLLSPSNGVKPDELKWNGLQDLIDAKKASGEKLTKQEALDHIDANTPNVKIVKLGSDTEHTRVATLLSKGDASYRDLAKQYAEYRPISGAAARIELDDATNPNNTIDPNKLPQLPASVRKALDEYNELVQEHIKAKAEAPPALKPAKFENYKMDGGENYREHLLTLPSKNMSIGRAEIQYRDLQEKLLDKYGNWFAVHGRMSDEDTALWKKANRDWEDAKAARNHFESSHWDGEPNVLAHTRMTDRESVAGEKLLHLEEIQSDWANELRKYGHIDPEKPFLVYQDDDIANAERFKTLAEAEAYEEEHRDDSLTIEDTRENSVPQAPFLKNWHELALRHALHEAVKGGYDRLSWTPGEVHAERYGLAHHVSSLSYRPSSGTLAAIGMDGEDVYPNEAVPANKLADYVGKDVAKALLDPKNKDSATSRIAGTDVMSLSNQDLKLMTSEGRGKSALYDKMIPEYLNRYGKKWGAKVGETQLENPHAEIAYTGPTYDYRSFVAKMPEILDEDDPYEDEMAEAASKVRNALYGGHLSFREAMEAHGTEQLAEALGGELAEAPPHSVPSIPITESMRKSVEENGQTLFQKSGRNPQEDTPEFKRWFGDSKVVDEQGNPKVVYHGTNDNFNKFDMFHPNKNDKGWLGRGAYFFDDPEQANSYTKLKLGDNANIMPTYIRIGNPYYATIRDKERLMSTSRSDPFATDDWTQSLKSKGHDGVILDYKQMGWSKGPTEYVVFDPTQIKSAIGNNGAFDPNDPNILHQDSRSPQERAVALAAQGKMENVSPEDTPEFRNWLATIEHHGVDPSIVSLAQPSLGHKDGIPLSDGDVATVNMPESPAKLLKQQSRPNPFRNGRYRATYAINKSTGDAINNVAGANEEAHTYATFAARNVLSGLSKQEQEQLMALALDNRARSFEDAGTPYNQSAIPKLTAQERQEIDNNPRIQAAILKHQSGPQAFIEATREFLHPNMSKTGTPDNFFMSLVATKDSRGNDIEPTADTTRPGGALGSAQRVKSSRFATQQATGSAAEYSRDYADILKKSAIDVVGKARVKALYKTLLAQRDGAGNKLAYSDAFGQQIPSKITFNGVDYPTKIVEYRVGRLPNGGQRVMKIGVPDPIAKDIDDVTKKPPKLTDATSLLDKAQGLSTELQLSTPAEITRHVARMTSVLSALPPVGQTSVGQRFVESLPLPLGYAPGVGMITPAKIGTLYRMFNLDMNDPINQNVMLDVMKANAGSSRPFQEQVHVADGLAGWIGQKMPAAGSAMLKANHFTHDFLFSLPEGKGLKGFDLRLRVMAEKIRRTVEGNDDPQRVREFANQFGQYTHKPDGLIEAMKKINPFAATTAPVQLTEAKQLFGDAGFSGLHPKDQATLRAETLFRGAAGSILGAMLLNHALSGHWNWQNAPGHEQDIELGKDKDGKPIYFSGSAAMPNVARPIRNSGLADVITDLHSMAKDSVSKKANAIGSDLERAAGNEVGTLLSSPLLKFGATAAWGVDPTYFTKGGGPAQVAERATKTNGENQPVNNIVSAFAGLNPISTRITNTHNTGYDAPINTPPYNYIQQTEPFLGNVLKKDGPTRFSTRESDNLSKNHLTMLRQSVSNGIAKDTAEDMARSFVQKGLLTPGDFEQFMRQSTPLPTYEVSLERLPVDEALTTYAGLTPGQQAQSKELMVRKVYHGLMDGGAAAARSRVQRAKSLGIF